MCFYLWFLFFSGMLLEMLCWSLTHAQHFGWPELTVVFHLWPFSELFLLYILFLTFAHFKVFALVVSSLRIVTAL